MLRKKPTDPESPAVPEDSYNMPSERLAASADRRLAEILREVDDAAVLLAEVLGAPEPERRALLENGVRFHSLQLVRLLETRSRDAGFEDPAQAVSLARLAVVLAERLDDAHYGTAIAEDARASAWAHLGNALRITSDHHAAEEALRVAWEHQERGGGDTYIEARILSFEASLRNAQSRYDDATRLLDDVIAIYREVLDHHEEGKALIKKGYVLGRAGRHEEAVQLIRRGLSRIDLIREPRLLVAARHNLTLFLTESGRQEEARESVLATRRLYLELGERMNLVRLRWLEGKILRELGHLEEAETSLREAMDAFLANRIGIDAALVALDLAMIYTRRGETAALKHLAAAIIPIFEWGELQEGALAALLLFRQAAETEQVTASLLHQVATSLQPARESLEVRFRTGG